MADDNPLLDPDYRYSSNRFTGDGSRTTWELNFAGGFISRDHVKAFIYNGDGTSDELGFDFITDSTVDITPPVADGVEFVIFRQTPQGQPLVDFQGGSDFSEKNLDTLAKQTVFASAETIDRFADVNATANEAQATSIEALETATAALNTAEDAATIAGNAVTTAGGAVTTANEAKDDVEALSANIEDLLGSDLSGLARLDTAQVFLAANTFQGGLDIQQVTEAGISGIKLLPDATYQVLQDSSYYGPPKPFADWVTLPNKPVTFPPAAHTQGWDTITGKPTTFAPSAHTHDYNTLSNIPSTFAPSAHTHAWSAITGVPSTIREIILSTGTPSGGSDGQVWMQYVP